MSIYSSTLIIKGTLNVSDAEFLKLLELDKSVTGYDRHKICTENNNYEEIITQLGSDDEVYVSSTDELTVIVSFALITDYSRSISLIKNRIEKLFPSSEYFLFFTETVSMLTGFVYGIGKEIIRKKYVQNGKYMHVYDHLMDVGELLEEEKNIFINQCDFVDGYPIKNKDYMNGVYDFNIGLAFIERQFGIKSDSYIFSSLNFNRNILSELSDEYIRSVNDKLESREIEPALLNLLKPLMKELKFKAIDFKEYSQTKKNKGFYKQFDLNTRVVLEVRCVSFHGANTAGIHLYIKKINTNDYIENTVSKNDFGIGIFSINSTFEMSKLHKNESISIGSRIDFNYFVEIVKDELLKIKSLISKCSINNLDQFFGDKEMFGKNILLLEEECRLRGHLIPNSIINMCLLYHSINKTQEIADSIMKIIDFKCTSELYEDRHNKAVGTAIEILKRNVNKD